MTEPVLVPLSEVRCSLAVHCCLFHIPLPFPEEQTPNDDDLDHKQTCEGDQNVYRSNPRKPNKHIYEPGKDNQWPANPMKLHQR